MKILTNLHVIRRRKSLFQKVIMYIAFLFVVDHDSMASDSYVGPDPADQSCDGLHTHVGAGRDRTPVL